MNGAEVSVRGNGERRLPGDVAVGLIFLGMVGLISLAMLAMVILLPPRG